MNFTETPISLVILAVTVVISWSAFNDEALKRRFLFNPYLVKNDNQWYRLFSHAVIHSDLMHLGFNMFVFYWAGTSLEALFTQPEEWSSVFSGIEFWGVTKGRLIFIVLYVGGFLFATAPSMRKHADNPGYNSLGASGAVSAILIGYILLNPTNDLHFIFLPFFSFPAFVMGILFFWYEKYMEKRGGTGIAHDAHISGAVFGLVFMLLMNYKFLGHFVNKVSVYIEQLLG